MGRAAARRPGEPRFDGASRVDGASGASSRLGCLAVRSALTVVLLLSTAPHAQEARPRLSRATAQELLFLAQPPPPACDGGEEEAQIRCLLAARYAEDPAAAKVALALYAQSGTVMGLLPEQDFDGAYRGKLHLVPRLAVGPHRKHLQWAAAALTDFDAFFQALGGSPRYRWSPLEFRFFESVKRRTPSAFAIAWSVSYNVNGSLFTSEAAVRSTLFHEVFHLNDQQAGRWSVRALSQLYDGIVARCGTRVDCLTPYTPDRIKVIGGTYYDFMPDNGVQEYAADLGRRYYTEHRALLHKEKALPPFKCGPEENGKAWKLVVDQFFGGVDLVPPCPPR